jgi:hypothetical protein
MHELRECITTRKTLSTLSPEASLKYISKQLKQYAHFGHIKHVLKPTTHSPLSKVHVTTTINSINPKTGATETTDTVFAETATVLQHLREAMEDRPPSIPATITFKAFVSSCLHWNEHTSTSPSGRHLVLYKSMLTAHCDRGGEIDDAKKDFGLPPTKMDELRVIHLFEADFNLLVGRIFGRRTVHNAVNHRRLHQSQYGKKGGECMDAAISKVLHTIIDTYSKTPMGQFESDATSCFVMQFPMLCFFVYGCPALVLQFWMGSSPTTVTK